MPRACPARRIFVSRRACRCRFDERHRDDRRPAIAGEVLAATGEDVGALCPFHERHRAEDRGALCFTSDTAPKIGARFVRFTSDTAPKIGSRRRRDEPVRDVESPEPDHEGANGRIDDLRVLLPSWCVIVGSAPSPAATMIASALGTPAVFSIRSGRACPALELPTSTPSEAAPGHVARARRIHAALVVSCDERPQRSRAPQSRRACRLVST